MNVKMPARCPPLALEPTLTLPETVSCGLLPENVRFPVPLLVPEIVKLKQAAFVTSTVTVAPVSIITSSADDGTTDPTQVLVALQLPPVEVEVIVAANMPILTISIKNNDIENTFFTLLPKI